MRLTMITVALVACSTPYQPKGFSGGYTEQSLGNGRWSISFDGNSYTSENTAMSYSHRRASELCPGGYDVVDANRETSYMTVGDRDYAKPGAALVVQCRGNSGGIGHWCTILSLEVGVCARQPGVCETFRARENAKVCQSPSCDVPLFQPCFFVRAAICSAAGCFTTPATCAEYERRAKRDGSACAVRQ